MSKCRQLILAPILGVFLLLPLLANAEDTSSQNSKTAACIAALDKVGTNMVERREAFTIENYMDDLNLDKVPQFPSNPGWATVNERRLRPTLQDENVSVEVITQTEHGVDHVYIRGKVTGSPDDWKDKFTLREQATGAIYTLSFRVPAPSGERNRYIELSAPENIPADFIESLDEKWLKNRVNFALVIGADRKTLKKLRYRDTHIAWHQMVNAKNKNSSTRRIKRTLWELRKMAERGDIDGLIDRLRPLFRDVEASTIMIQVANREIPKLEKQMEEGGFDLVSRGQILRAIEEHKSNLKLARKFLSTKDLYNYHRIARQYLEKIVRNDKDNGGQSNPTRTKVAETVQLAYSQISVGWRQQTTFPGILGREERPSLAQIERAYHHHKVLLKAKKIELQEERKITLKGFVGYTLLAGNVKERLERFKANLPAWIPSYLKSPLVSIFKTVRDGKLKREHLDDIIELELMDVPLEKKVDRLMERIAHDRDDGLLELMARTEGEQDFWDALAQEAQSLADKATTGSLVEKRYLALVERMEKVLKRVEEKNLGRISIEHPTPPLQTVADVIQLSGASAIYYWNGPMVENDPIWNFLDFLVQGAVAAGQTMSTLSIDVIQWAARMVGLG